MRLVLTRGGWGPGGEMGQWEQEWGGGLPCAPLCGGFHKETQTKTGSKMSRAVGGGSEAPGSTTEACVGAEKQAGDLGAQQGHVPHSQRERDTDPALQSGHLCFTTDAPHERYQVNSHRESVYLLPTT